MPQGECTVTLQDVAIQLGLPCDGVPLMGATGGAWRQLCAELLGVLPPEDDIKGQRLRMRWLTQTFGQVPENATEDQLVRYTRAYILRLIGGWLFPDKSSTYVYLMYLPFLADLDQCGQYSWGSAVLAHLYRGMCNATDHRVKEISGCLCLLHLWAWDRFPALAPAPRNPTDPCAHLNVARPPLGFRWGEINRQFQPPGRATQYYRRWFDMSGPDDFVWQPYDDVQVRALIPDYCTRQPNLWRSVCPLICMHIIEWHHPDRVLRQFGMDQPIPDPPKDLDETDFHGKDLRGQTQTNWFDKHRQFLQQWELRYQKIVVVNQLARPLHRNSEYCQWYRKITRRWLDPASGSGCYVADRASDLRQEAQNPGSDFSALVDRTCRDMQVALGEQAEYLMANHVPAPIAPEIPGPEIVPNEARRRRRRHGFLSLREPTENIYDQPSPSHAEPPRHSFHVPSPAYEDPPRHSFSGFAGPSSSSLPLYIPDPPDIPESSSRSYVDYTGPPPLTQQTPAFDIPESSSQSHGDFVTPSPYQMVPPRPGSFTEYLSSFGSQFSFSPQQNAPFQRPVQPFPLSQSLSSLSHSQGEDEGQGDEVQFDGQRRYPDRVRRPPRCGTGGNRGHPHN